VVAAFIQAKYVQAPGATSVVVAPDTAWTAGNLLVAVATARGTGNPLNTPGGWTNVPDDFATDTFDGGISRMCYRVVVAGDTSFTWTKGFTGSAGVVVGEWSGVGAFVDHATASVVAASATLTAGPLAVPSGGHLVVAAFIQATRDGGVAGGLPLDYDWDVDYTEITTEADEGIDHSGPAHTVAYKVHTVASPTESVTCTAADSDTYGWMLAAFEVPALPGGVYIDPDDDGFTTADRFPLGHVESWRIQRGATAEITGAASIGSASIMLNNPSDDRYNPLNTSSPLYPLLTDGVPVWIGCNSDGALSGDDPRGLFGGRIKAITPIPVSGLDYAPKVELVCEDALGWYGRTPCRVEDAIGRTQREIRDAVLTALGETRVDLAREPRAVPLSSWDSNALAALEAINRANGTRHFVKPSDNADDWYAYTTRDRQWRLNATVDYTLAVGSGRSIDSSGWTLTGDTVINQQKATVTPVVFTQAAIEVWAAETLPFRVSTGSPKVIWVEFDDFVKDAVLDENHSGSSVTATLVNFGHTAKITLTSSGTTTMTRLSIAGRLARRLPAESYVADDLTSQGGSRGLRAGSDISGEFVGAISFAKGIASHVVWRYGNPQFRPTLTIQNWLPQMFEIDLFDTLSLTIAALGMTDRIFEVVGLTLEGKLAYSSAVKHHVLTLVLQESRTQTDPGWFVLDSSVLDGTDILAH
jgi:hypothetical protein